MENTQFTNLSSSVSDERKPILQPLIDYISDKQLSNETCRLNFICTHNARRSHMSQIWAAAAAVEAELGGMEFYSGGVEVTRFHRNALSSMMRAGFEILSDDEESENPRYFLSLGDANMIELFSKRFDDDHNPNSGFAAVMVCSDADTNCPYVPGAEKRISVTYDDPKIGDGTPEVEQIYDERSKQIAAEMLYVMTEVSRRIG